MSVVVKQCAASMGVARLAIVTLAMVTLFVGPVAAQGQEGAPEAGRVVLAERLMALSQGPNITKQIEAQVRETVVGMTDLPPDQRNWMTANMPRMARGMMDRLIENLVEIYARTFTAEELQAQISFYETPAGRSIIEKSIAIGAEQTRIIGEHEEEFLTDLMTKFCQRFDCSAGSSGAKGG